MSTLPQSDIESSSLLDWEPALVCRASFHPHHIQCQAEAEYMLSSRDSVHEEIVKSIPLCHHHTHPYWDCVLRFAWCPCPPRTHVFCPMVDLQIERLK